MGVVQALSAGYLPGAWATAMPLVFTFLVLSSGRMTLAAVGFSAAFLVLSLVYLCPLSRKLLFTPFWTATAVACGQTDGNRDYLRSVFPSASFDLNKAWPRPG